MGYDPARYREWYQKNRTQKLAQVKAAYGLKGPHRVPDRKGVRRVGSRRWKQEQRAIGLLKSQRGAHFRDPEFRKRMAARNTTHGQDRRAMRTVEYQAYVAAIGRCNNPNRAEYPHYGGRGIEFRYPSFEAFYADLGPKPSSNIKRGRSQYSLDRIDPNGHYEPGNCRWATQSEQVRNRRKTWNKRI